jgi:sugar O-acyltransferase (sialic acid O-acetyltransferase NeuD family)
MRKKQLAIFGAGGLGRELKSWIQRHEVYEVIGFFDDHIPSKTTIGDTKVLGGAADVSKYTERDLHIIIAVGDPKVRTKLIDTLRAIPNITFPVLIHPTAVIDDPASIQFGKGTVVTAGCVLTTNITLGEHTLINLNSTIGHDCTIGEGTCIMPGVNISGQVIVGKHVLLGTGASVLNNITIGDNARVGAGAVVTKSLPADCTAVGVPAKLRNI